MLSSHFIDKETEAQTGSPNLPKATQNPGTQALLKSSGAPGEGRSHRPELSRGEKSQSNHHAFLIRMEDRIKGTGIKYH